MNLPICQRLLACCDFVQPGDRVADVGTDHGYLGIHLLQQGVADHIYASDVNPLPLESSRRNAEKYGMREKMDFFLSDGVQNVPRDFTVMVCAGMGADTMISILEAAPWLKDPRYRLILQCQSHRPELRIYLAQAGYAILRETLVRDGRFLYTVMEVRYDTPYALQEGESYISPALLHSGSPLLGEFYERVLGNLQESVAGMEKSGTQPERLARFQATLAALKAMEVSK